MQARVAMFFCQIDLSIGITRPIDGREYGLSISAQRQWLENTLRVKTYFKFVYVQTVDRLFEFLKMHLLIFADFEAELEMI